MSCEGVGPGASVVVDEGAGGGGKCTLNFVFAGRDGARYIGTAGHCALGSPRDKPQTRVWPPGRGPAVRLSEASIAPVPVADQAPGAVIGHVVYATYQATDLDNLDFALIRLAPGVVPYTSVPYFGGPRGINRSRSNSPDLLRVFGRGATVGRTVPARNIYARSLSHESHAYGNGVVYPNDSGSPVLDSSGQAVGVLIGLGGNRLTLGPPPDDSHQFGLVRVFRVGPAMDLAAKALKTPLRLVDAPR